MKNITTFLTALAFTFFINAQNSIIKGIVSDASGPLPGANILVKGTARGTQTDFDGNFEILAKNGDELIISYIGYKTKFVTVKDLKPKLDIVLEEDISVLEEVVVAGYGIKKEKRALGYSVAKVSSESVSRKLSGKASGISISYDSETSSSYLNEFDSGILTAGEINDIEDWSEWLKIKKNKDYLVTQENWNFYLENKIKVHITDKNGKPLNNIDVAIFLENEDESNAIMKTRTDVFGNAYLFRTSECDKEKENHVVQVYYKNSIQGKTINSTYSEVCFTLDAENISNNIDVMFTIDATGSMGDEINYLKSELRNIIGRIDKSIEQKRVGLTFYRDHGDEYVVKEFDFNSNIDLVKNYLDQQHAGGGGDYEEAIEEALKVSLAQSWDINSKSRLLFLMLDAPPHFTEQNVDMIKNQIKIAQKNGIKIIPVVASDANKTLEFLMRFFSISTNGTYVFLTDDSGVGNKHLKPSTDDFEVEKLNDLIVRLIEKYSGVS